MKDNFSTQSDHYAKYRPGYPSQFFMYLNSILPVKQNAWDCGTGNGQVASELAKTFDHVYASDISQSQLRNAFQADNISYSVQSAEQTDLKSGLFDLVIVAQAIHWFNFDRFYAEVRRTAKSGAVICAVGYGRIEISEEIDQAITDFYHHVIGEYWDKERRYIDENYETIPFPFEQIEAPEFVNELQWSLDHLAGYLNTWSAVKHFIKQNGHNPVDLLVGEITQLWGNDPVRNVRFPLLLRIGKV